LPFHVTYPGLPSRDRAISPPLCAARVATSSASLRTMPAGAYCLLAFLSPKNLRWIGSCLATDWRLLKGAHPAVDQQIASLPGARTPVFKPNLHLATKRHDARTRAL